MIEDFLEVFVIVFFSKMKDLADSVLKLGGQTSVIQVIKEFQLVDRKVQGALNGFSALGQLRFCTQLSCVFNFICGEV